MQTRCFARLRFFLWVPCTVHETRKYLNSANITLKLGPTALFIHLKIILLQYFQFSAISNIQTAPQKLSFFLFIFFPFSLYFMKKVKRNPKGIGLRNICIENILRHFLWKKKQVTDFFFTAFYIPYKSGIKTQNTTTHSWHDSHSTSISTCGVFGRGGRKDWNSNLQKGDSHKYTFLKWSINKCPKGTY